MKIARAPRTSTALTCAFTRRSESRRLANRLSNASSSTSSVTVPSIGVGSGIPVS
jgi:hypothetical protein